MEFSCDAFRARFCSRLQRLFGAAYANRIPNQKAKAKKQNHFGRSRAIIQLLAGEYFAGAEATMAQLRELTFRF
jgi:hypothetical protein